MAFSGTARRVLLALKPPAKRARDRGALEAPDLAHERISFEALNQRQ
jgi:hypothetical protein